MKFRVCIETYDQGLIRALEQLDRKKGKYVRAAIESFFHTKKGKTTLNHILLIEKHDSSAKTDKKGKSKKKNGINIDDFLT